MKSAIVGQKANLAKSKGNFFYREMAILFSVKCEMAALFFMKRDLDPPLPPSQQFDLIVVSVL